MYKSCVRYQELRKIPRTGMLLQDLGIYLEHIYFPKHECIDIKTCNVL